MSVSPPEEVIHFRGKSLSPESPRPLHYPEPSKIPVLENQIDPVFNDTATYQKPPTPAERPTIFNHENRASGHKVSGVNGQSDHNELENGDAEAGTTLDSLHGDEQQGKGSYPTSLEFGEQASYNQPTSSASFAQVGLNNSDSTVLSSDEKPVPVDSASTPASQLALSLDQPPHASSNPRSMPPTFTEQAPAAEQPTTTLNEALSGAINLLEDQTNADVSHAQEHADVPAQDQGTNSLSHSSNPSPSTATAPSAEGITAATTSSPKPESTIPETSSENPLPAPAGLPPRPPPQEKPSMHPNYSASDDISSYHQIPSQKPLSQHPNPPPASNSYMTAPGVIHPHMTNAAAPGTAPSYSNNISHLSQVAQSSPNQFAFQQQSVPTQSLSQSDSANLSVPTSASTERGDDDLPWGPEIQRKYDEFLREERVYVTEGLWDRFSNGSRLFIGNLPTEKVTKRDLFHIFHHYGKLAQISIKQAYGFVQFLDAGACQVALHKEQNMTIRGRRMHLEISKPQKNTRNPGQDNGRGGQRRRSPDYTRGSHGRGGQRGDRSDRRRDPSPPRFSDFRDELPRRRDDYRPVRSPSPRGRRNEYGKRERSPDMYDGRMRDRSRSPYRRGGRFRSPSPVSRGFSLDDELPFPRRDPRNVPDVQVIIQEELDQGFLYYIEKGFRDRGLRIDVLLLPPRVSVQSAVRRQILEGVQAIINLQRTSYYSGKLPLQVFDRTVGVDNVRYDEYNDLTLDAAIELVIRAKKAQAVISANQYPPAPIFAPQFPQPAPPQQAAAQAPPAGNPQLSNLISTLDASGLQRLLGALQQPSQQPTPTHQPHQQPPQAHQAPPTPHAPPPGTGTTDLAGLLSSVARQQQNQGTNPAPPAYPQAPPVGLPQANANAYAGLASNPAFANNPALNSLLSGNVPPSQMPPGPNQPQYMNPQQKW